MLKGAVGKVMWVGRATVFLVGLAVVLALVFGVASVALGANGKPFILGKGNVATKVSTLTNKGLGAALSLNVQPDQPPLAVNSSTRVDGLNADQLDGQSAEDFQAAGSKAADADTLDGKDSSEFAASSHDHDDRYFTEAESDGRYLGKTQKAADSDKLDGMEPGQLPGSVASVATFGGSSGSVAISVGPNWVFVGQPTTVTTSSSQRLVGVGQVPLGVSSGAQLFRYDLCYQPSAGGAVSNFTGQGYSVGELTTARVSWTAVASRAPGAGTWQVGFCVRADSQAAFLIDDKDFVNGWVQVVNQ